LDEPTIGLDVVAQAAIQKCLREYNAARGVTMLLTSHYMRDVEALCRRVLIINHGRLIYDGALGGVVEQFGRTKLVRLQFAGDCAPEGLDVYGEVVRSLGPAVELRIERTRVAEALAAILDRFTIIDVGVQDPPLEQVIARVFQEAPAAHESA
jgi:ABC-2 type transport system ATP-binding protein